MECDRWGIISLVANAPDAVEGLQIMATEPGLAASLLGEGVSNAAAGTARTAATGSPRQVAGLIGSATGTAAMVAPFAESAAVSDAANAVNLGARAKEIHSAVSTVTQNKTTIAAATAVNVETGATSVLIGSSEVGLRPAQAALLRAGEIGVTGPGHAEVTVLDAARQLGLIVKELAASRSICPACWDAIEAARAKAVSPAKAPM